MRSKNFKETLASPDAKLFSEDVWFYLHRFAEISQYSTILQEMRGNIEELKEFFNEENIYHAPLPTK